MPKNFKNYKIYLTLCILLVAALFVISSVRSASAEAQKNNSENSQTTWQNTGTNTGSNSEQDNESKPPTVYNRDKRTQINYNSDGIKNLKNTDSRESSKTDDHGTSNKITHNICEIITHNIQIRVTNFDKNKENHGQRFLHLHTKLADIISKLELKGFDVSKLSADLDTLNGLIQTFNTDYQTFIDDLKNAQQFACGSSQGDFANALKTAKDQLSVVRQDVVKIKDFYINTIRPDIISLRSQIHESSQDND